MSVKSKIKRLNKKLEELDKEVQTITNIRNIENNKHEKEKKSLENVIKFMVKNNIKNIPSGGVQVERKYIDEMEFYNISIIYEYENDSYIIKIF